MVNKHEQWELTQMQSLPLELKIRKTQQRIREWYNYFNGSVYLSFSGGKDSMVLKHIIDNMYNDIPSVFVNTGLEFPEIQTFVREIKTGKYNCFNTNIEILRPEMKFNEVILNYGYPVISKEVAEVVEQARKYIKAKQEGFEKCPYSYSYRRLKGLGEYAKTTVKNKRYTWEEQQALSAYPPSKKDRSTYNCEKYEYLLEAPFDISSKCCNVMKKKPLHEYEKENKRYPYIATMASESAMRKQAWLRTGCNTFDSKKKQSKPMSFWTEQDVLHYIQLHNIPYASIYGDIATQEDGFLKTTGADRTGCIFCMFGCHLEKEPNRFQRLEQTHPKQYAWCIGGGTEIDGKWVPDKNGLGLGKVLDFIGVNYENN